MQYPFDFSPFSKPVTSKPHPAVNQKTFKLKRQGIKLFFYCRGQNSRQGTPGSAQSRDSDEPYRPSYKTSQDEKLVSKILAERVSFYIGKASVTRTLVDFLFESVPYSSHKTLHSESDISQLFSNIQSALLRCASAFSNVHFWNMRTGKLTLL